MSGGPRFVAAAVRSKCLFRHKYLPSPISYLLSPICAGILSLFITFSVPAHGAFFMRLRMPTSQTLKGIGGRVVRTTEARVNGCEARVSVIGFDRPLAEAEDAVRRLWKLPAPASTAAFFSGTWITRMEGDVRQDILLFPGSNAESCSAWLVECASGEGGDLTPSGGDPLPGATLLSCIEMKDTGSVLTLHDMSGSPSDGARAAEAGLATLGWETVLAGDTTVYFAKDGHAAVACATGANGRTRVAILRAGAR